MNKGRITRQFLYELFQEIQKTDFFWVDQIRYKDCIIHNIRSKELERTYDVFHIVGDDIDFIFKCSENYEMQILKNLNNPAIRPRLSVPQIYEYLPLTNQNTGEKICWVAMEFIAVNKTLCAPDADCSNQVDGILMYEDGKSKKAWGSAGREIARIHATFWEIEGIPVQVKTGTFYEKVLAEIESHPRMNQNQKIKNALDYVVNRLKNMPTCLVHFDLFPINIMIKERNVIVNGISQVSPRAYIVDWAQAKPAPYILDAARVISHCHRIMVYDENELKHSPKFCESEYEKTFLEEYYKNSTIHTIRSEKEFEIDLLCGQFFELARMYIQMPTYVPEDSYDRFYYDSLMEIVEKISLIEVK